MTTRLRGPDVVRGAALIGVVVMNYHGYLFYREETPGDWWLSDLLHPATGPLTTRFAATFVLVAGVGVTLLTRRASGSDARTAMRWRLVRRGALVGIVGLLLDEIWPGTILLYYGAMFIVAAVLFTLASRVLLAIAVAATLAAWGVHAWILDAQGDGRDVRWLTAPDRYTADGLVFDTWVNGTHPLLPWLAFFCVGIVLGRVLHTTWWRPVVVASGFALYTIATLVNAAADPSALAELASDDPFDRSPIFVMSALGTALLAYAVLSALADRFPSSWLVDIFRRTGQMTFTLYLAHAIVFWLVVDQLHWIRPAGLDVSLTFALVFWVVGIAFAVVWHRRWGRGPVERAYRALTG